MTPEEFRALLDTYGADLTRWPHAARQGAQRVLEQSAAARDAFADAQAFDDLLAAREPALAPAERRRLTDAILDNLPDAPLPRAPREFAQPRRPVPGFGALVLRPLAPLWVACLGVGLALGVGLCLAQPHPVARATVPAQSGWIEIWAEYGR